jgi:type III restriction enzyme
MSFLLEELPYQKKAIDAVVGVFDGQQRNFFHNPFQGDVQPNILTLNIADITANKRAIIAANGLTEGEAHLCNEPDLCIEMETGTGKTLVYLRTIYELCEAYGFTKFIILVPSVPIREGVLDTIASFAPQLHRIYGPRLHAFEYDSKKLTEVKRFISGTDLQVMVMTTQSFNSDDNIINQTGRDDSPDGLSYWQALARVRPILIMDEPQEGMDTPNITPRIQALNSVARLRYSATHKLTRNLLYRLSPYEAYNEHLVKKIEVLSVAEKNDEATMKLELLEIQVGKGDPKAKLMAWCKTASGFKYKETKWLDAAKNRSLETATGNPSYRQFNIERIHARGLRTPGVEHIKFTNGVELTKRASTGDFAGIFRQQLYWLCFRHFQKTERLRPLGIKPLSLIFIDRVASYTQPDGLIRTLFHEEFPKAYRDHFGEDPPPGRVEEVQSYYFAKSGSGEFTDNENSMAKQKEIYDEILRDKEALLSFANPRQFIFSHSALGVGWDNPNVFNIATLNQTFSDIKKRQEIGRGLRICRNQEGKRVYDPESVTEGEEINQLTVIPNETYETFVSQYQSEIGASITPRHTHKGKSKGEKIVRLCKEQFESERFRKFWKRLGQRTDYTVHFDEEDLVTACVEALNKIEVPQYEAEIVSTRIDEFTAGGERTTWLGTDTQKLEARFTPMDLIEELSENTQLAYPTVIRILAAIENADQLVRNPPRYLHEATRSITRIKIDEMVRTIDYRPTGAEFGLDLFKDVIPTYREVVPTPNHGVYDHAIIDSGSSYESLFAKQAEIDPRVICILKLPDWYKIPTPSGNYTPDFGLVVRHKDLRDGAEVEVHLVVETKSTSVLEELDPDEQVKIRCAIRHFHALGIGINEPLLFQAPVDRLNSVINEDPPPHGDPPTKTGFYAPKTNLHETLSQALASE